MASIIPGGIPDDSDRKTKLDLAVEAFLIGDFAQTVQRLKQAADGDPDLPPSELLMASLVFAAGDNANGMVLLERCAIDHPDEPGVFMSFAQLAVNSKRFTDAQALIEKAAGMIDGDTMSEAAQNFQKARYFKLLTSIQLQRGLFDEAESAITQLKSFSTDQSTAFTLEAELAFKQEQYDRTLSVLKQIEALPDSSGRADLTLVKWFQSAGKNDLASQQISAALEAAPDDDELLLSAAQVRMSQEDFVNALVAIRDYEKLKGETDVTSDLKGRIAFARQAYGVAELHFKTLGEKHPGDPNFANIYALCLVESGDTDKQTMARTISERVANKIQNNPLAIASLAYIYLRTGDQEKAAQLMQQVIKSNSATPEIAYFVARYLYETGKPEQAGKILEQTLRSEKLFLYREAAQELYDSITGTGGELPAP